MGWSAAAILTFSPCTPEAGPVELVKKSGTGTGCNHSIFLVYEAIILKIFCDEHLLPLVLKALLFSLLTFFFLLMRAKDESMFANFKQYGLSSRYGDVIACDFSLSPWRTELRQATGTVTTNIYLLDGPGTVGA